MKLKFSLLLAAIVAAATCLPGSANAAAVRAGFDATAFGANDDEVFPSGSIGIPQPIGFTVNFFGVLRTTAFVNNNGNITFDSGLTTFTPFDLNTTGRQIIAPFFADVDTRSDGDLTEFGGGTVDGHLAWGVSWRNVDYFAGAHAPQLNTFQLVLVDRSDIAVGDFDIEFNYDQITWETGDASSGSGGLGGASARAGFSNGTGAPGSFFELAGSAVNGAFLDGGPAGTSLIHNSLNSAVDGRYIFMARNGTVSSGATPEPATMTIWGLVAVGCLVRARRRSKAA